MPRTATDLLDYLTDAETTLPEPHDPDAIAEHVARLHAQNGGATYNLYFGDMAGQPLYAVALYPEESATFPGREIEEGTLREYVEANRQLLRDARNNVGSWYNNATGETFLDITTTFTSRGEALLMAARYNQIALYDLAGDLELATGGTGEPEDDLPPAGERLPPLTRNGEKTDG